MGQKVHPTGFRLGITKDWKSRWFSTRNYRVFLQEDLRVRKFIKGRLKNAAVAEVEIERSGAVTTVTVHTSKPGMVIGRGGTGVEELKAGIEKVLGKRSNLRLNVQEITKPYLNAQIVTNMIIEQIERRLPFRRILRQSTDQVRKAGAQGVKVMLSGRLGGAEIARTEVAVTGKVPLQTLRADIDYARATANTTYGTVGVKVWIYRGEVFEKEKETRAA